MTEYNLLFDFLYSSYWFLVAMELVAGLRVMTSTITIALSLIEVHERSDAELNVSLYSMRPK